MKMLARLFAAVLLSSAFILPAQAVENYTLDKNHTYVEWKISHFGFSSPSGKWLADGTLALDEAKPQNSKVDVTINVADIVTGIPKLDEHLQKEEFFNVKKFPKATFVSDKITMSGKDSAKVHGMLTLLGVTKPITLNVKLNKMGVNPISNKKAVGFSATTTLKRSDFGMTTYLPGLGDEVKINIEAEGVLAS